MAERNVTLARKAPADRKPKSPTGPIPAITIEDDGAPIPVRLIGRDYNARIPKATLALRMSQDLTGFGEDIAVEDLDAFLSTIRDFLILIFGTATADVLMARLDDPDDILDVRHILDLVEKISELASGNPPTSSPA